MFRFLATIIVAALLSATHAQGGKIGINVLLNREASDDILADLGTHGKVLDVIPQIHAVTLQALESQVPAIQALGYVAAANADSEYTLAACYEVPVPDFADGANTWNLDAINVTDSSGTRTVAYDGEGVYIAVIDSGLPVNWREYFPEERIATQFARGFSGGGGDKGTVSEQSDTWEHDNLGHGTIVT